MKDKKLTPWFPGSVSPVRPGRYEVRHDPASQPHHNSRFRLTGRFRLFDGVYWRGGWTWEDKSIFGTHHSHQWRGLARQPATE